MTQPIHFDVRIDAERSLLHIETRVTLQDGDEFYLPVWIPGSYFVREFERALQDLRVDTPDGSDLRVERADKTTWRVHSSKPTEVSVCYAIYGHELSVRSAHVDTTHAFFNGANALLCFPRFRERRQSVSIDAPNDWTSFVSLPVKDARFIADNYVHLADTAFEIGPHPHRSFAVDGIPHRMIFWGGEHLLNDLPRLQKDIEDIIVQNRDTFARALPYERYDIIFHITPEVRGGLEHRDSTTLATPWHFFESEAGYLDMLSLIAHEHFHAYNGRRLAPASLEHIDYRGENYTQELWVIEGFTSYYDELNTLRAGKMTRQQWLDRTGEAFTRLMRTFGRTRQSLTEASFDAWIRLYRPYEHTRNQTVSYYLKGSLVALAIDLRMRQQSDGNVGLEQVVQQLWAQWADANHHYTTDDVLQIIESLTDNDVATDARRWVTTTDAPPYKALLASVGIRWEESIGDTPSVGFALQTRNESPVVTSIDEAHHRDLAALLPGDEIVSIDGRRVTSQNIEARLKALATSTPTQHTLTVFQLGRQRDIRITLRALPEIKLSSIESATWPIDTSPATIPN